MLMRKVSAKDRIPNGPLRGAVVSGVTAAMAAASLAGVPNADATCLGIFGISINDGSGGHCSSSLFSLALGLGPGTSATALGNLNAAIAVGTNVEAIAGNGILDSLNLALNFGNADDGATSTVTAGAGTQSGTQLLPDNFNLAANLGGNAGLSGVPGQDPVDMDIFAGGGYLNVALNIIGNRNTVHAEDGFLNFAINAGGPFSFPNGSDNIVTATNSLSAALNSQTFLGQPCSVSQCGNTVTATGPLSLVVAAGVVRRLVEGGVGADALGANRFITLANSFNADDFEDNPNLPAVLAAGGTQGNGVQLNATGNDTNGVAAGGTQGNRFRLNATGDNTNGVAASGTQKNRFRASLNAAFNRPKANSAGGSVHKSVSDSIKKWAKKSSDPESKGTSGLASNAKADADSTSNSDK